MTSPSGLWKSCVHQLESELSEQQLNTWIRPLYAVERENGLTLLAPNRFVLDWVHNNLLPRINELVHTGKEAETNRVALEIGSSERNALHTQTTEGAHPTEDAVKVSSDTPHNLNLNLTFDTFIEGKSNQLPKAAAMQVASNPGEAYNPLLIYGGVGLGKTHLLHAIGNQMRTELPSTKIIYLHSERFVAEMVKALRHNTIVEFKQYYRSVNALLIDDIQFFAGKERSQEEFFHTFNTLLEGQQQVILTCDRYPKEVDGLEERLKSRFAWGLAQAIEPPELETRVAIMQSKAALQNIELPEEVAFFIGERIRSNIRELEGALHRVIANAKFSGSTITLGFAKKTLHDLLALQDRLVTIESIKKTVAEYYKLRISNLLSARRSRSIARPRQIAMSLAKELTNHSLPEIGDAFGGRDHTTVLHAYRKIKALRETDLSIKDDYTNLLRKLSS